MRTTYEAGAGIGFTMILVVEEMRRDIGVVEAMSSPAPPQFVRTMLFVVDVEKRNSSTAAVHELTTLSPVEPVKSDAYKLLMVKRLPVGSRVMINLSAPPAASKTC